MKDLENNHLVRGSPPALSLSVLGLAWGVGSNRDAVCVRAPPLPARTPQDVYLISMGKVLVDETKDPGVRQLAGIMIKNALAANVCGPPLLPSPCPHPS